MSAPQTRLLGWGAALLVLGALIGGLLARSLSREAEAPPPGQALSPTASRREAAPSGPLVFDTSPQRPEATPALLPAGVAAVYLFYDLTAASAPAQVRWSRNGQPLATVANEDIQPESQDASRGVAVLRPPGGSLLPGLYEAEVTAGEERLTATFQAAWGAQEILAQPAPAAAEVQVSQVAITRGIGRSGTPEQPLKTIRPTEGRLYFVFRYEQAEPGIALTVKWFLSGEELTAARREVVLPSSAGWAHAWAEVQPAWPPGECRVVVYVSGDAAELASASATVQ